MSLRHWIRDKLRGYSDADIKSVQRKINNTPRAPGTAIRVTSREMKALAKAEDVVKWQQ